MAPNMLKHENTREKTMSEYARRLIEASLDPLITISREGRITDVNQAFANATGKSRESLIDTDFFIYFTNPQQAQEIYEEVFAEGFVKDYPLTILDHAMMDVLFNGSVYKDEEGIVVGAVVVARDITAQKKIETELIEAKTLAELATTKAEGDRLVAENAVKAKQQFLSNMSHEIRTPMNAIIGFTKVLLKTELSDRQQEYLGAIKLSGDALIVLINDILDLAKVDAGKMQFEAIPFKLEASIAAMMHLFEPKIQEKNLTLIKEYDTSIPQVIIGDAVRLHQVIMNLMSNAVKFTNAGSITVRVRLLAQDDTTVSVGFVIADTGIGISEDKIATIFENFQQASSETARLFGGTGLGLAIAKQLVEQQGGHISATSELNGGSVFSFNLNFKKTTDTAVQELEENLLDTDVQHIRVLVAEDMPLNQLLMKTLLDDFGFERDIVDNGRQALDKMRANKYNIILMDLQMPEMNGFETTDYIRNVLQSSIPIIALTADVTTADLAKCTAVGMNDYIAKPVDEKLLRRKIVEWVKNAALFEKAKTVEDQTSKDTKYTDLEYLIQRTKNDPELIMEMIDAYLKQTPPLVVAMKKNFEDEDWESLYAVIHKMIPSFAIMGINPDFESMARKVQAYARTQQQTDEIKGIMLKLEHICTQACQELSEEFNRIKTTRHDLKS